MVIVVIYLMFAVRCDSLWLCNRQVSLKWPKRIFIYFGTLMSFQIGFIYSIQYSSKEMYNTRDNYDCISVNQSNWSVIEMFLIISWICF